MKKILLILFILMGCAFQSEAPANDLIRIAILQKVSDFIISTEGSFQVVDYKTSAVLGNGSKMLRSRVITNNKEIAIGERFYPSTHLVLFTNRDFKIHSLNSKKRYREAIHIIAQPNGQLMVVNEVNVEAYVRGVLFHEISDDWPMEAMKAQAVAVRSFGLYQRDVNKKRLFDVTDNIYSQVYGGKSAERYRTNLAVKKTRGEILVYNNKVLPAYFHSNSGGHTEDASELWKVDLLPLKGHVDEYVERAPGYKWKKNFRSSDVQKKLNGEGFTIGVIKNIVISERTNSGRVKTLLITDQNQNTLTISGKKFREVLGPNNLRSNLYEVKMQGYYFDLIGKGWGHGVGLCQWGAYSMAQKRFNYKEILDYYYRGATLTNYTEI